MENHAAKGKLYNHIQLCAALFHSVLNNIIWEFSFSITVNVVQIKTQTGICCNIAQLCVPNITTVCGLALFFFFLTWLLSAGRQKVTSRVPMKRFSMFRKELVLFPTDLSTCYSLIKPPPQPDAGTDQQVDIDWGSATTHQHMHLSELDVF